MASAASSATVVWKSGVRLFFSDYMHKQLTQHTFKETAVFPKISTLVVKPEIERWRTEAEKLLTVTRQACKSKIRILKQLEKFMGTCKLIGNRFEMANKIYIFRRQPYNRDSANE